MKTLIYVIRLVIIGFCCFSSVCAQVKISSSDTAVHKFIGEKKGIVKQAPYFIQQIERNQADIIKSILLTGDFSKVDFSKLEYTKQFDNCYIFKNIPFDGQSIFKSMDVYVTPYGLSVDLISDKPDYFDNPVYYFGTEGILYPESSYTLEDKEYTVYKRQLGKFTLFDKQVKISVLKSEMYGCKIMLGFYY